MADEHPKQAIFEEVVPVDDVTLNQPSYVEAYAVDVSPAHCGALVKRLSRELPLDEYRHQRRNESSHTTSNVFASASDKNTPVVDLSHLKRVKRTFRENVAATDERQEEESSTITGESSSGGRKRQRESIDTQKKKPSIQLQVLIGSTKFIDHQYPPRDGSSTEEQLLQTFSPNATSSHVQKLRVPARLPDSKAEWDTFNSVWPTAFYPQKTKEFREQEMALSEDEIEQMVRGMEEAIHDASLQSQVSSDVPCIGAVVVSPLSGDVVSRASDERDLQKDGDISRNPLATSIILALQGVSRTERGCATKLGMESLSFQNSQYLCTGFDVYTTKEPSVYEAMALVHSRIRRLVFGCSSESSRSGICGMSVHSLPGTNHKYRAFVAHAGSEINKKCLSLQ